MQQISTTVSLSQEDYFRLKTEAERQGVSVASFIRSKIGVQKKKYSKAEIAQLMRKINTTGKKLGEKLKGFDSLKALREIRYQK